MYHNTGGDYRLRLNIMRPSDRRRAPGISAGRTGERDLVLSWAVDFIEYRHVFDVESYSCSNVKWPM